MKPAITYTLGLITGIAVTAGLFSWSQRSAPSAATPPSDAIAASTVTTSPASSSNSTRFNTVAPSAPSLESALKEIQEAGMVVIPQEFARFLMPSLLSTRPEPAVREILQLDDREASALAKARINFDRALQQTIDAHLRVTDIKNGIVTATLPAFTEERQKLINAWRTESLSSLDSESAALASHIDFDRAMYSQSQGRFGLTVTFQPTPDSKKIAVEYHGQTMRGDQRENYSYRTGVPASQFLRQFPSLESHFPQFVEEPKP